MRRLRTKPIRTLGAVLAAVIALPFLTACLSAGDAADPAQFGYTEEVTYHAMGGRINSREQRAVNYEPGSLIYEPSGTSGMMVYPTREGHVLAGWYTDVTEAGTDDDGDTVYEFKAEDRWDFNLDRIEEDMTLYARWIKQGDVQYIDAATGDVLFEKNVTAESPVQALSAGIVRMIAPEGRSFLGYFRDAEMTETYEFDTYQHIPLVPDDEEVWSKMAEEFPEYIEPYEYTTPTPAPKTDEVEEDGLEQQLQTADRFLFLKKLGWNVTTEDEEALATMRARLDEIYEGYVQAYSENTAEATVYLGFSDGLTVSVKSLEDLGSAGKYGFLEDKEGMTYVLEDDIDFEGETLKMAEHFTGTIEGNGHTIRNATIKVRSAKREMADYKAGAIFEHLEDATLSNITFENLTVEANLGMGIAADLAPLAIKADNVKLDQVHFKGVTINSGRGDKGNDTYRIGDLYLDGENVELQDVTMEDLTLEISDAAERVLKLSE